MKTVVFKENATNKTAMERYMRDQFLFMGIRASQRKEIEKDMLKESKQWSNELVLSEVQRYYHLEEREYQYVAADLLMKNIKRLNYDDIRGLFYLINEKSWWDSVDTLRSAFSKWCQLYPERFIEVFTYFSESNSFWDRRVAINLQLGYREKTDTRCLEKAILQDLDTQEFFIQKAIGWSLREYSKTDKEWVRQFIDQHPDLSPLAIREGSKYL